MTTGDIIKRLRLERGMAQSELAEAVGYAHKSQINKIEMGKSDISQKKIALIAKALEVTPDVLFFGTSEQDEIQYFAERISGMDKEEREDLKAYMDFLVSKRNKSKKEDTE